jgi:hypothetical protein
LIVATSGVYGGGGSLGFYAGDGEAKEMEEGEALRGRVIGVDVSLYS